MRQGPKRSKAGWLGGLGILGLLLAKFGSALKFLAPVAKFIPVLLKTGGSMFLMIWVYAQSGGWPFAIGFVVLIFVHEMGHLLAAQQFGLRASAPVFIPFLGAHILLKDQPPNAWVESVVGIGGPVLGSLGAGVCYLIHVATGDPLYARIAYVGFWLNLFNLAPIGFLDGGRIVTALSPWLWIVGYLVMGGLLAVRWQAEPGLDVFLQHNFLLLLILVMGLPRLFTLFRKKDPAALRYFEIPPEQRWTMAVLYFGLIGLLVLGMRISHVPV
jgi:Zn-dependent protease